MISGLIQPNLQICDDTQHGCSLFPGQVGIGRSAGTGRAIWRRLLEPGFQLPDKVLCVNVNAEAECSRCIHLLHRFNDASSRSSPRIVNGSKGPTGSWQGAWAHYLPLTPNHTSSRNLRILQAAVPPRGVPADGHFVSILFDFIWEMRLQLWRDSFFV